MLYFYTKSLKASVYFILTVYFNLEAKILSEIFNLYFIKYIIENLDSHARAKNIFGLNQKYYSDN